MSDVTLKMLLTGSDRGAAKALHNLGDEADRTEKKHGRLGSMLGKVGKVAALGLAGGIVAGGIALAHMAKAAAEDEVGQKRLAVALHNTAGATKAQVAETETWISKQGAALGVTDDELRPALGRLAAATHDVGKAQKLASLAMDVSAGSGKSLDAVTTALAKAQNGNVAGLARLGVATKDAAGKTLSLREITQNLSDTYGGQAAAKAGTFQGKMDRLKLVFDETKETIGAKLIPVLTRFGTWILGTAVPAVTKFVDQMKSGTGAGGRFADILDSIRDAAAGTAKFLMAHKNIVAAVAVVYGVYKVAQVGVAAASKAVATATKIWAAAQWLMNAALTANPIGIVIVAIAALVAGLVIAYKKSETFRNIVNGVFHAVADAGRWLWNNVLQPVFGFLVKGFATVMDMYGRMLSGLSKVPGFGWAKSAAEAMHNGADKARELGASINKIPNSHNTDIGTTGLASSQSAVRSYRDTLDRLPAYIRTQIVTQHTDKFDRVAARATGGPVRAHSPYLVGENEPELFVPDQNGTILNGAQMRRAAGGGGAGSGDLGTVKLDLALDGKTVQRVLLKLKRENGNLSLGLT